MAMWASVYLYEIRAVAEIPTMAWSAPRGGPVAQAGATVAPVARVSVGRKPARHRPPYRLALMTRLNTSYDTARSFESVASAINCADEATPNTMPQTQTEDKIGQRTP